MLERSSPIVSSLDVAIRVKDATFRWASVEPANEYSVKSKPAGKSKPNAHHLVESKSSPHAAGGPFAIPNLNFEVARGHLVGIVGPVGSGKSSILQGVSDTLSPHILGSWL